MMSTHDRDIESDPLIYNGIDRCSHGMDTSTSSSASNFHINEEVYADEYEKLENERRSSSEDEYTLVSMPQIFKSKSIHRAVILVGVMALLGCAGFVATLKQPSIDVIQQTMMNAVPFNPSKLGKSGLDIGGEYIRTKEGKFKVAEKEDRNTDLPTMQDVNKEIERKELRNVVKELVTKNPGKFDAELKKYTDKEEFKKHMELIKNVEMKMKEEERSQANLSAERKKEKPLKKAASRAESKETAVEAAEAVGNIEKKKPLDAKGEKFERFKEELVKSVQDFAAQQLKDKEVHERAIANQPASAKVTAEEAFDHKQKDAMFRLKQSNDEKLDILRKQLWPPKLYRRLTARSKRDDSVLEEITQKRLNLLEKSLGTDLSEDLTNAVNSLPKTLESYEDETRMCRYLGVGCTSVPTSFPTFIDPVTNLPGKGPKGGDTAEVERGGGDADEGWGLESGDNPIAQNTTGSNANNGTNDHDNALRMTDEERKKEIIEAYEEELQNEDKGVVLADKQEEMEDRRAAKDEWLEMHHGFKEKEKSKQETDQEELDKIIDEKHAEEQELHDSHVTKLNARKHELIQAHTALQENNEKEMRTYRLANQKKLNDKRAEVYPGYTAPDDQPKVEESIIYKHEDDDDGDDDDYHVSNEDDYDSNHNIDDADGGDLSVELSGSLTNETEVSRDSMDDLKATEKVDLDDDAGKAKEDEGKEENEGEGLKGDKNEEGVQEEDGKSHDGDGHVEEVGKNHDGDDYIDPNGEATSSGDDDGYYDDDTKARAAKLAHRLSSAGNKNQKKKDKKKMLNNMLSDLGNNRDESEKEQGKKNSDLEAPCKEGEMCKRSKKEMKK